MSVGVQPRSESPPIDDPLYDVTTDQFFEMIAAGVFPEDARVYLRDGRIVEKMAKTNVHSIVATIMASVLTRRIPDGWFVFSEGQILLDETNARLPDLAIVRGGDPRIFLEQDRYPNAHDVGLVIEIAVTSLAKDLGPNLRRYAKSLIPTYWVADVVGKRILAHTSPVVVDGQPSYAHLTIIAPGQALPLVLDGYEVGRFGYEALMP